MRVHVLLRLSLIVAAVAAWTPASVWLWWRPRVPLRTTLAGTSRFRLVGFSPNGKTLALASCDLSALALWDVDKGSERLRIRWKGLSSGEPVFSPDSHLLAVPDSTGLILWDTETAKPSIRLGESVKDVTFCPDGTLLAGGVEGDDELFCSVKVWELASGKALADFGPCCAFRFCPRGRYLAVQTFPGAPVRLWSVATRQEEVVLKGFLASAAFSPEGDFLAIADTSCIRIYRLPTAKEAAAIGLPDSSDMAFGRDGKTLVFSQKSQTTGYRITAWDLNGAPELASADYAHIFGPVSFTLYGSLLAVQSQLTDRVSAVWDVGRTPPRLLCIGGARSGVSLAVPKSEQSIAFTPDGQKLIVRGLFAPDPENPGQLERWWLTARP
jgi:WD40 repeat protein